MADLPVDFNKLKITSKESPKNLKSTTYKLPIVLNPFYDNDGINRQFEDSNYLLQFTQNLKSKDDDQTVSESCQECRFNRNSDVLLKAPNLQLRQSTDSRGIHKRLFPKYQTNFLNRTSRLDEIERGVFIRKPILRPVRACLHSYCSARRKLLKNISTKNSYRNQPKKKSATEISKLSNSQNECFIKQSMKHTNSCNLNTLRKNIAGANEFNTIKTTEGKCQLESKENSGSTITSFEQNNMRATTSCSQQAGNGASNDDITIDELASYFDTLVHIPKKMSSMAEMMYI